MLPNIQTYSSVHEILSVVYNSCFPLRKVKERYHNRKPRLVNNDDLQKEYVKYRNTLNHLLRIAEMTHYNDPLDEHKKWYKRSWGVIKMVINKNKCRITTQFRQCNKIIEIPTEIANNFVKFFISVRPALLSKNPNNHKNPNDYINISILVSFFVQATYGEDIANISYRLKNNWMRFLSPSAYQNCETIHLRTSDLHL